MSEKKRDPRTNPQVGGVVYFREKPSRRVKYLFTDSCGNPCVEYTVTRTVQVKSWMRDALASFDFDLAPEPK